MGDPRFEIRAQVQPNSRLDGGGNTKQGMIRGEERERGGGSNIEVLAWACGSARLKLPTSIASSLSPFFFFNFKIALQNIYQNSIIQILFAFSIYTPSQRSFEKWLCAPTVSNHHVRKPETGLTNVNYRFLSEYKFPIESIRMLKTFQLYKIA